MQRNTFTKLQEKWLKALESGDYRQIRANLIEVDDEGKLCDGLCCLGVATKIFKPDHFALKENGWDRNEWAEKHDVIASELLEEYGDDEATAPPDVVDAFHLHGSTGAFRFAARHMGECTLVGLNDSARLSFAEIAAFIRDKPWLVFSNFDYPEAE